MLPGNEEFERIYNAIRNGTYVPPVEPPSPRDELIGQRITRATLSADKTQLVLETTTGGRFILETEGECCSSTWIESIDDPDALLGTVLSIEDIDMPDLDRDADYQRGDDYIAYYGLRITTTRGRVVIDYRNASNGYYGGSIEIYRG